MLKKLKQKKKAFVQQLREMNEAAIADPDSFDQEAYDKIKSDLDKVNQSIARLEELQEYQEEIDDDADGRAISNRNPSEPNNNDDEDPEDAAQRAANRNRQSIRNAGRSITGEGTQTGLGREEDRNAQNFSLLAFCNAIVRQSSGGRIEGYNAEVIAEAEVQAKAAGVQLEGFGVPQSLLIGSRIDMSSFGGGARPRNDMTVGTASAGGNLVPTELRSIIDVLREKLQVRRLGAQLLGGLTGDIEFPVMASGTSPTHKAENAAADEYTPTVSKLAMSPKRLPVFTEISKKLLIQSSTDVEAWLRNELAFQLATVIDQTAINGSGTGEVPEGILNTSGIGSVAVGANGGAVTRDHLVDMETEIYLGNADVGTIAWLTTPGSRGALKKTKIDAGSGLFVWPQGASELESYRAEVSTNVPSNTSKGSGTNLNTILLGVWSQLMIGQWGGLDIVVNPYSRDTEGLVRLVFTTFYDLGVRYAESFVALTDHDLDA